MRDTVVGIVTTRPSWPGSSGSKVSFSSTFSPGATYTALTIA